MNIIFYKYQGTGNDFIMIDNRHQLFPKNNANLIEGLCDRRFGIGADGLILLENDEMSGYRMVYFNSDGKEGSMCGNGGRCFVAFADFLKIIQGETSFDAADGLHEATISNGIVSLKMQNVSEIKIKPNAIFMDTGSPHHVQMVENLEALDVFKEGAKLRYGVYGEKGSNINFVSPRTDGSFYVRTYERGVEDETLSCGTGVTAVALAMHHLGKSSENKVQIHTKGGDLQVEFDEKDGNYANIFLIGSAKQVFKGEIEC